MIRDLAMVAIIHYLWLSLGSSLHAQVVSKNAPDSFGGITGTEEESALTAGPLAGP